MVERATRDDILSTAEAAAYLRKSVATFRRHVAPELPAVRLTPGRQTWFRDDLDRWLDLKRGRAAPSMPRDLWQEAIDGGQGGSALR